MLNTLTQMPLKVAKNEYNQTISSDLEVNDFF